MDSLIESLGLLCLAIRHGQDNDVGRTKLQKMIYFADRYLDWDIGDYRLHYYGPFSSNVASTLKTARNELIKETRQIIGPYHYDLTEDGSTFMDEFINTIYDKGKTQHTIELFQELSTWSKDNLELASTLDYVSRNIPSLSHGELVDRVSIIKDNFNRDSIEAAYQLWNDWKEDHNL